MDVSIPGIAGIDSEFYFRSSSLNCSFKYRNLSSRSSPPGSQSAVTACLSLAYRPLIAALAIAALLAM